MNNKTLPKIKARFWSQSIIDSFNLSSCSELLNLNKLYNDDFNEKYQHLFANIESVNSAFLVFCNEPFEDRTWKSYFNGTPPTKKRAGEKPSAYDIVGALLPHTKEAHDKGCFNILQVFTASYIKDAIKAFSEGVIELYKLNNQEIKLYHGSLERGGKPELYQNYHEVFEERLNRGSFKISFDIYAEILNQNSDELGENKAILELMELYIRVNFFGESLNHFCRLLVEGHGIKLMKENYNIPPVLWKNTFPVINDALSLYSNNKDELFWIEENELFTED
jgi:hypothetical protein